MGKFGFDKVVFDKFSYMSTADGRRSSKFIELVNEQTW